MRKPEETDIMASAPVGFSKVNYDSMSVVKEDDNRFTRASDFAGRNALFFLRALPPAM
jgi:hypothetical protein